MRCWSAASSMYSSDPTSQVLALPFSPDTNVTCTGMGPRDGMSRRGRVSVLQHAARCRCWRRRSGASAAMALSWR